MSKAAVKAGPGIVVLELWADNDDPDDTPDVALDMTVAQCMQLARALNEAMTKALELDPS